MSRAKLAIASTADGAPSVQAFSDSRAKIAVAIIVACAVGLVASAGPGLGPSRVSHGDAHYTDERARASIGCAVDEVCVGSGPRDRSRPGDCHRGAACPALCVACAGGVGLCRAASDRASPHARLVADGRSAVLAGDSRRYGASRVGVASPRSRSPESSPASSACFSCSRRAFSTQALRSWGATTETMLADQRLAGLLMLAPARQAMSSPAFGSHPDGCMLWRTIACGRVPIVRTAPRAPRAGLPWGCRADARLRQRRGTPPIGCARTSQFPDRPDRPTPITTLGRPSFGL